MVEMSSTTAIAISSAIKNCLLRSNLPLADCRGQCYDGASVMSGSKAGVAAIISKVSDPVVMFEAGQLGPQMLTLISNYECRYIITKLPLSLCKTN